MVIVVTDSYSTRITCFSGSYSTVVTPVTSYSNKNDSNKSYSRLLLVTLLVTYVSSYYFSKLLHELLLVPAEYSRTYCRTTLVMGGYRFSDISTFELLSFELPRCTCALNKGGERGQDVNQHAKQNAAPTLQNNGTNRTWISVSFLTGPVSYRHKR